MKRILALSMAFAVIAFSATAQEKTTSAAPKKDGHARMHDGHKKGMMKDLNLTEAQKTQMKAIREDKSLSKDARKAKMDNVFTADQKTKMAQQKTKMKAQHEQRAKEMQTKLGLSNDQAAKLKAQNKATHAQMKALKEDKSLSKEDKKAKMKSIKDAAKAQRNTVLSADQQKKMDEYRKEGKGKKRMNKQAK